MYICISEVGGKEASADPNREIGFGFVSCSCRACVRAGEAKLRERVRDDIFCIAGGHIWKISSAVLPPAVFLPDACLMVESRVFIKFPRIGCYVQGFHSMILHMVAMCKGFKVISIVRMSFSCCLQGFQVIGMALVAICKGFKVIVIVWTSFGCYLQGFQGYLNLSDEL